MHGMTSAMASMLVLSIGVTGIMDAHSMELNTRLGTTNYKLVEKEGEAGSDGSYFDSEFSDLGDLIHAKEALAEEIAGEGCVLLKNQENNLPLDVEKEKIILWGLNSHNPTLGGMIGSSTAYSKDSDQKCYDLETALTEKGFAINMFHYTDTVCNIYGMMICLLTEWILAGMFKIGQVKEENRIIHQLSFYGRRKETFLYG